MADDLVQIIDRINQQVERRLQRFADRLRQHEASRDRAFRDAADRIDSALGRTLARAASAPVDRTDPTRAAVLVAAARVSPN